MAFKRLEPWGWQMFAVFFGRLCALVQEVAGNKFKPWHYFFKPPFGFEQEDETERAERLASYEAENIDQSMSDEQMALDAELRAKAAAQQEEG